MANTRRLDDGVGANMHKVGNANGVERESPLVDLARWAEDRALADEAVAAHADDDVLARRRAPEVAADHGTWGEHVSLG